MDALGINGGFLLAQIVNFLAIMLLLRMFLYEPVLNMLEERKEKIRTSLNAAEEARAQAATRSAENEKIIAEARREGQKIIQQAEERARRREAEIMAEAREAAEMVKKRASSEIDYERQQALSSLRGEVAQLSLAIARKAIGQELKLNRRAHARIIDEVLAEVGK
ncbi:MAG: F0F1 ATP synthase subunit B [Ardenticatenaceae bacterium]